MDTVVNETTWQSVLSIEKQQAYFKQILTTLDEALKQGKTIYPPRALIFNALKATAFLDTKVVILGQDPYHGPNQAMGLSFSVPKDTAIPPSLQNIYKELYADLGCTIPSHGCLLAWAKQGVLLLNATLTVEAHQPQSHAHLGWQRFTDKVIQSLNHHPKGIVFLLWGASAQKKQALIDTKKHVILKAPHPSPLSAHRGFLGCRHFSQTNEHLIKFQRSPINWQL